MNEKLRSLSDQELDLELSKLLGVSNTRWKFSYGSFEDCALLSSGYRSQEQAEEERQSIKSEGWLYTSKPSSYEAEPPEYCTDYSVTAEAWRNLPGNKQAAFGAHLGVIVLGVDFVLTHPSDADIANIANATPRQRAEALYYVLAA